jgi:tryptophan synthase alpha chain
MKTRIDQRFEKLRAEGRKGFVAYVTAGDPDLAATEDIVLRLEDAGVDVIELGIPFSDPLADGRVNQEAAARALAAGATLKGVLQSVRKLRRATEVPILFFTYMNPVHAMGVDRLIAAAAEAGVDGMLFLDLPAEEAGAYLPALARRGLNNICLVTPTSPDNRIERIVRAGSGFVYCVSREGVTGMQKSLGGTALDLVRRTKRFTDLPVALGFGISTPGHARAAAADADAVVVGSAIVSRFHEAPHTAAGRKAAAAWVRGLVRAVKEV